DFGRRFHAEAGRRYRFADRARRRLPLRRQAQRAQPRHLRSRPGIRRRDPQSGGLTIAPDGEERVLRVSNHEAPISPVAILRDAREERAPQGQDILLGTFFFLFADFLATLLPSG